MDNTVLVRAAVVFKEGKGIDYVWETADIEFYIDTLGYTLIGWEDMYI